MNSSRHSQSYRSINLNYLSPSSSRSLLPTTTKPNPQSSIFQIYGIGYSYNKHYGNPNGVGFMITESIALTTNSVLLDEEVASRSFGVFSNGNKIKFDPAQFFYTNRGLNFTVVAIKKEHWTYINILSDFELKDRSRIFYYNQGLVNCEIIGIDKDLFSYSTGADILPGTPIFSLHHVLQGIHHTRASAYTYSIGTKIDSIVNILCSVVIIPSEDSAVIENSLGKLLKDKVMSLKLDLKHAENFGEGRYLYWIEWYTKNLYKYDVLNEKWSKVQVVNIEQFLTQETSQWKFNWGSRIVYLPDGSFLVLGGNGNDLGGIRGDVYQFIPDKNMLYRKKSMLDRRDGPGVIYRQNFVYVVGGRFSYTTCEKYNIKTNTWSYFSSMIHGRYEPVACLLQGDNFMYVAGGQPIESVGKTIERYSFSQDRWEGLQVVFPIPLLKCGIFPVTQTKFALLGGQHLNAVIIFEVVLEIIDGRTEELFKVFEIEELPETIETVYPVVYNILQNKVYMTKSPDGQAPSVLYYSFRSFLKASGESIFVFKKNIKLPPLFTKRNLLNYKFPQ